MSNIAVLWHIAKEVTWGCLMLPGAILERYGGLSPNHHLTKATYALFVVGAVYLAAKLAI